MTQPLNQNKMDEEFVPYEISLELKELVKQELDIPICYIF